MEGEGERSRGLGDVEKAYGNHEAARKKYEEALRCYSGIPNPQEMGEVQRMLARISEGAEREERVQHAKELWVGIDRADLVEGLIAEFGDLEL